MLLWRACDAVDVSGTLHWTPAVGSKTSGMGPQKVKGPGDVPGPLKARLN
jgi:hypothetical protein